MRQKVIRGFTIIEVSLFIAISGLLFAGLAIGTSTNVARQRYNDAVNDFVDFLQDVYGQVENVENANTSSDKFTRYGCSTVKFKKNDLAEYGGRSDCAIYGKIIIFGQEDGENVEVYDLIGESIGTIKNSSNKTYQNMIDDDNFKKSDDETLAALKYLGVGFTTYNDSKRRSYIRSGDASYLTQWSATIEESGLSEKGNIFKGAVLIVRSPINHSIYTYYYKGNLDTEIDISYGDWSELSSNSSNFNKNDAINFCINSDDSYVYGNRRRNVRINTANAHDATAVELIELDSGDNKCEN